MTKAIAALASNTVSPKWQRPLASHTGSTKWPRPVTKCHQNDKGHWPVTAVTKMTTATDLSHSITKVTKGQSQSVTKMTKATGQSQQSPKRQQPLASHQNDKGQSQQSHSVTVNGDDTWHIMSLKNIKASQMSPSVNEEDKDKSQHHWRRQMLVWINPVSIKEDKGQSQQSHCINEDDEKASHGCTQSQQRRQRPVTEVTECQLRQRAVAKKKKKDKSQQSLSITEEDKSQSGIYT